MTAFGVGRNSRRRLTSPRIAETVADELRHQIIDGELADGDLLPPQAALVDRFNVSLVSLREALRILETEGLLSVRRGNQGGAVVHAPRKTSAAYMLGLVLQSEDVLLGDLAAALQALEPTCAAMAAQQPNRATTVVPELQRLNAAMVDSLGDADDPRAFAELGRQFHDAVVRGCGNQTMIAVVGSLEALWTGHGQRVAEQPETPDDLPSAGERQVVCKTHAALADAIELGDADHARQIAARHLADTRTYVPYGDAKRRIVAPSQNDFARAFDRTR